MRSSGCIFQEDGMPNEDSCRSRAEVAQEKSYVCYRWQSGPLRAGSKVTVLGKESETSGNGWRVVI